MQEQFQFFMANATAPSVGRYGEKLFGRICEINHWSSNTEHKNGIDFNVSGIGNIDVKVVRHLNRVKKENFRRVKQEKQLADVFYAYIIFWADLAELRIEKNNIAVVDRSMVISKDTLLDVWNDIDQTKVIFKNDDWKSKIKQKKTVLIEWIRTNWGKKARVIQRGDRARNETMFRRGWGADNFYEPDDGGVDLVVLLNVDKGEIYEIYAYPMVEKNNINWLQKNIGPNPSDVKGFNPQLLDSRFIFSDVLSFQKDFLSRFDLNGWRLS